jgi:CubicO group peptidase (beta-lactamase class C family)
VVASWALGEGGLRLNGLPAQVSMEDCVPIGGSGGGDSPVDLPNTRYWRDMGHPWGGLHSTAMDIATLLQCILDGGCGLWSAPTLRAALSDQNTHLPSGAWGIGWSTSAGGTDGSRIRSGNSFCDLGDLLSGSAFGHTGSVGSLAWADPSDQTLLVICSDANVGNGTLRRRASNAVVAALAQDTSNGAPLRPPGVLVAELPGQSRL